MIILAAALGGPLRGQETSVEYRIKAAYLFNFAKFVEWPTTAFAQTNSPIIVGVLGKDVFNGELERSVANKTINGQDLVVRQFEGGDEFKGCHILFISPSEKRRLPKILQHLKGTSILTVSDIEQFSEAGVGGMITFVRQQNTIKFEINLDVAERAGLKLSSKLLQVARVIRSAKEPKTELAPGSVSPRFHK